MRGTCFGSVAGEQVLVSRRSIDGEEEQEHQLKRGDDVKMTCAGRCALVGERWILEMRRRKPRTCAVAGSVCAQQNSFLCILIIRFTRT